MSTGPQEKTKDFTGVPNKELTKKQQAARKAAKRGNYTDRNLDGIPDRDQLDWNLLSAEWQWVAKLMQEVDEIRDITEKAVTKYDLNTQQGINNFINDVIGSNWWMENGPAAREAFAIRATDPTAWAELLENARNAVQSRAQELGAQLDPATLESLANQFATGGWKDRTFLLDRALADKIGMEGAPGQQRVGGNLADQLRQLAVANGMTYSDQFYLSAAQSVANGLTNADYWLRQIREEAASYWPVYGEQIRAGVSARDLLSGYITVMARTLEVDPSSISMDDPYLRRATTGLDESGRPRAQSLWEFQQALRDDPRWMQTDQAVKSVSDIGTNILERFGIL